MSENSHQPAVNVVQLFRESGRPEWRCRQFEGQLDYVQSRELLDRLRKQGQEYGYLADLKVDSIFVSDEDDLPTEGLAAEFIFKTAYQGSARFFHDAAELTTYPPLGRGEFPSQFYLVKEDYLHGNDESVPDSIARLKDLTNFVNELSQLADHKFKSEGSGAWTMVFRTGDSMSLLETKFGEEILDLNIPVQAWEAVKNLTADKEGIHQKEKIWMFKTTMCEFLMENKTFHDFIKHAENWTDKYNADLNRYLHNFSFEETRRKIAEEHSRFTEQISKMLGDITTKILSLPLAAVIVMVMKTQSSGLPWWILVLIIAIVSWILHNLVAHHKRTLPSIERNIDMVFGRLLTNGCDASISSQNTELDESVKSLNNELKKLKNTLAAYQIGIWGAIPVLLLLFLLFGDPSIEQSSKLLNYEQGDSN